MRTLGPCVFGRRRSIIWVAGSRPVASKSLPGLGCGLSGGVETEGGRRGGGSLIWTASSLSYLTSGVGPTLKVERRQWASRLRGEKLEHHIEVPLFPNQPPFQQLFSCATGGCFYGTMTLNLIHRSKLCCVSALADLVELIRAVGCVGISPSHAAALMISVRISELYWYNVL